MWMTYSKDPPLAFVMSLSERTRDLIYYTLSVRLEITFTDSESAASKGLTRVP